MYLFNFLHGIGTAMPMYSVFPAILLQLVYKTMGQSQTQVTFSCAHSESNVLKRW